MIIGLLGFIGSGKGTVASYLTEKYNFTQDSFASSLKDVCSIIFGWPRHLLEGDTNESRQWREVVDQWWSKKLNIPDFTPRLALQSVGTDALRNHFNQDIWFLILENRIRQNPNRSVVISDVRFCNEIDFVKNQSGILVRIERGTRPIWYDIAAEANAGDTIAKKTMETRYSHVHYSEWASAGYAVDYVISNNGSIEDLKKDIDSLISNKYADI